MGGALMKEGTINAFITAADTVCMDGSVANKIGTYQYALAANANNVPYYVLRQSGPDNENKSGGDIVIEQRSGQDILTFNGVKITPNNVKGRYPCFDVTPSELVSSIITDRGIFNANEIHSYNEKEPFLDNLV
jgi:methylthioribose-1-phosphate isomerase